MFSASPAVFAVFSLLRARWGKVNSLRIWRMKGVLLWLRTKGNCIIHLRDLHWAVCRGTGCAISCLWAFWVGTFTSLCRNPNSSCILAQQTEISLLPCAIYFPNQLEPALPPNLSKPAIKWRCYIFPHPLFFLAGNEGSWVVSLASLLSCTTLTREETVIFTSEKQRTKYSRCSLHFPNRNENVAIDLWIPSCF